MSKFFYTKSYFTKITFLEPTLINFKQISFIYKLVLTNL